ncbi:unnamed protein product [Mytilus coruscus]|uniref:Peptidase A2 domain-containing protein n=1 Tax=Mytilus coruscus TaxID=42192 RepID=A0A6J8EE55_MYTCO|nr:unnamed protein product [Mytilus coruscus]
MEKKPTRMDQDLQFVKSSIHYQRVLLGYKKSNVRRVQFDKYYQDDSDSDPEIAVRVVNKKQNYLPWQETIEKCVQKKRTGHNITTIEEIGQYSVHPAYTGQPTSSLQEHSVNDAGLTGYYRNEDCGKIKGSNIAYLMENKPVDILEMPSQETSSLISSQHVKPYVDKAGLPGVCTQNYEELNISEVSVNDPYGPTVAANLILNEKIYGVDVDALVDTAAQSSVTLKGAGAENKTKAIYASRLSIRISKTETTWRIIVADITDFVLLGLYFLHLRAVIDLADYTVKINKQTLHASAVKSKNKEMKVCSVSSNQNVVIPSMTAIELSAMLEGRVNNDICIQLNQKLNGVIMPYIVTSPEET